MPRYLYSIFYKNKELTSGIETKEEANDIFFAEAKHLGLELRVEKQPNWITKNYSFLLTEFGEREFQHKDASNHLNVSSDTVSTLFKTLRKEGLLSVRLSDHDSRIRIYKLNEVK